MKWIACFICLMCCLTGCAGTNNIESLKKSIAQEGMWLYRSEMASWYGSDIFLEKFKNRERIGGYVSYPEADGAKCVFYSNDEKPIALGTMTFNADFDLNKVEVDLKERELTELETDLSLLRLKAIETISKDTLFEFYKNTNLNVVPCINGSDKKVYVLTAPTENGVVLYGNDYLITFDKNNSIINKKKLHKGLIPVTVEDQSGDRKMVGPMHTHLPEFDDFITPTDICTTMLYGRLFDWESCSVTSAKYISIWNCKTKTLEIKSMDELDKEKKTIDD